jgi:peroxiredoxin
MRKTLVSTVAIAAVAGVIGVASLQAGIAAPRVATEIQIPARADNFQLTDHTRMHHELHYYKYAPAIVLMSYSAGSDFSAKAAAEFEKTAAQFKDKGVLFFMINSETGTNREAVAKKMKAAGLTTPVLMDELQLIGESLGVQREGEVFVINPAKSFEVAYHGPLDNRFTKSSPKTSAKAKDAFAADAVAAVLSGGAAKQTRVAMKAGKTISFPARGQDFTKISYAKDVAPIIEEKCASCHVDGGIAPFAMNSYEVVKGFAPMIRETIRTDRMPPYFADPHIGTFKNDQSMTPDQTKTLVHWLEAAARRG